VKRVLRISATSTVVDRQLYGEPASFLAILQES